MNIRPITRRCIDCNIVLKNRSKTTLRCRECNLIYKSLNKKGRQTGECLSCGKKLSTAKNKTSKCKNCASLDFIPWNKNLKGLTPWNKGKSIFKDKEEYRIHFNKQRKELRKIEPIEQKIPDRIRTLIRNSIRAKTNNNYKKNTKTENIIGCTISEYKKHIELKFTDGMSWENYGNGLNKWNIDHIKPISLFDLSDVEQQKLAFNYKNCQPMWSIENFKKSNKFNDN